MHDSIIVVVEKVICLGMGQSCLLLRELILGLSRNATMLSELFLGDTLVIIRPVLTRM